MGIWDPVDSQVMMDMPDVPNDPNNYWDHIMGVTGVTAYPQLTQLMNAPAAPRNYDMQPQDYSHNAATFGTPNNVSSDKTAASSGFLDRNFPETMSDLRGVGNNPTVKSLGMGFKAMGGSASKLAQQENASLYESARKQLWSINSPEKMPTFVPGQAGRANGIGSVNAQELYRYWLERLRVFSNIKEAVK